MRKSRFGFTIVELAIVVLVLGILLTVAIPFYQGARERAWTHACLENLTKIDQAKQLWQMENNKDSNDEPVWGELIPRYLKTRPLCPTGGEYEIRHCGTASTCSKHDHSMGQG